jgi:hypothetical protein
LPNENVRSSSASRKLADVIEDDTLTLDFRLSLISRSIPIQVTARVTDDRGPIAGATIDVYAAPCVGRGGNCFLDLPEDDELVYTYDGTVTTAANGTVTINLRTLEEFTQRLCQFRVTAPDHQNRVFEIVVDEDNIPTQLEVPLPRL